LRFEKLFSHIQKRREILRLNAHQQKRVEVLNAQPSG